MFDRAPLLERSHKSASSPTRIPAKLSLARKNDASEREAERNAAQLTSRPTTHSIAQPSMQRKAVEARTASSGLPAVDAVLRSPGQPLDARARALMEPLFLRDFSKVRVHTDDKAARSARALNAQAYTFGSHVAFGAGRFAPETDQGRRLIAHELTHVVQQQSAPRIQRMIATEADNIDLSSLFQTKGVVGCMHDRNVYFHKAATGSDLDSEILLAMLSSGRTFVVKGDKNQEASDNLESHVEARKAIVDMAKSIAKNVANGDTLQFNIKEKMNPKFWQWNGKSWDPKKGVDPREALDDLKKNPTKFKYQMACNTAKSMALLAGGEDVTDKDVTNEADWVAGDGGFIGNKDPNADAAQLGENIIYVGFQKFFGFPTTIFLTLLEWMAEVTRWGGTNGGARLSPERDRPTKGLAEGF